MLPVTIPAIELWNEETLEFIQARTQTLQLEHSLVSISKWEAKWGKSFFSKKEKTYEETMDYIRCMTLTQNVDPEVYRRFTSQNLKQIEEYINAPMTATTFFNEKNSGANRETVTSELIYYWMTALNIPFECQKWHINRLITLIKICGIKNSPPKKMSSREIMKRNSAINAARRKKWGTRG